MAEETDYRSWLHERRVFTEFPQALRSLHVCSNRSFSCGVASLISALSGKSEMR